MVNQFDYIYAFKNIKYWVFLVVQWLRISLLMQGTWVQSLVREDLTRLRATKPEHQTTEPSCPI